MRRIRSDKKIRRGKTGRRLRAAGIVCAVSLGLCACGGSKGADSAGYEIRSSDQMADQMTAPEQTMILSNGAYDREAPTEEAAPAGGEAGTTDSGSQQENSVMQRASVRKLIRTVDLEVETREFDSLMSALEARVAELEGYIESMDRYNGSSYSGYHGSRSASLSIRIPQEKLDLFLSEVSSIGNVVRSSEYVEDVTLTYVDLESRRNALAAERDRLLELMGQAQNMEDLITIEERLSEIRYQLESMESQLRTFDNRVEYSTVNLSVEEVRELTPVEERTAWQRMGDGFRDSVRDVTDGMKELGIWLVIHIPYLIVCRAAPVPRRRNRGKNDFSNRG